ncbi:hypothetical protein NQZ68_025534 [Dissostichus eleginoides]|nr:hypothetical protein NQZ68_025534 [Dissostichus eleginoides]
MSVRSRQGLVQESLFERAGLDRLATDESQAPNPSGAVLEMKRKPGACPSLGRAGSTHTSLIVSNPTK